MVAFSRIFSGFAALFVAAYGGSVFAQTAVRPATLSASAETTIQVPQGVSIPAHPGAVVLRSGNAGSVLRTLHVKRQIPVATLRTNPVIRLGNARLDMTPVLSGPHSLATLASRLRAQPNLAQVRAEDTSVVEVDQGLVVHQYLAYRVQPGACSTMAGRLALAQAGASCPVRMTDEARAAAFADRRDPHYIADPRRRVQELAKANQAAAAQQAEVAADIAQLRTMLADPAQRSAIDAAMGPGSAARLAAMSNDNLEGELAASADTEVEQVLFVPARDKLDMQTSATTIRKPRFQMPETLDASHPLKDTVFLTGFTLGRDYEWSKKVSVTIHWCVVGCKKTYYIEAYAGFDYGFGLRFPIRVGGTYAFHRDANGSSATLRPTFVPIDGSAADYASTGLDPNQVFDGKELVAEFGAWAGVNYKVPVIGSGGARLDVGKDFTDDLPPPFTHGQFRPPAPNDPNPPSVDKIFDQFDLIGGRANFGVVAGQVFPAVQVGLTSNGLRLKLTDEVLNKVTEMTQSGATYNLGVRSDGSSSFTIGDPVYNLAFTLTPGLDARLSVNLAVWSDHWDWPVWFPQIAVTLPPGGANFACHAETVCSRHYRYAAAGGSEEAGEKALPSDPIEAKNEQWRRDFTKRWQADCANEKVHFCEVAIDSLGKTTMNIMNDRMHQAFAGSLPMQAASKANDIFASMTRDADQKAVQIVLESKVRDMQTFGQSIAQIAEGTWGSKCVDQKCKDNIHAIGQQFVAALVARQKAHPMLNRSEVLSQENMATNWSAKYKAEVDASVVRNAKPLRRPNTIQLPPAKPKVIVPPGG